MSRPSVFPTGVTIYNKEKAWGGYTLFPTYKGATLVDMNGRIVKIWAGITENPIKMLPGGQLLGTVGTLPGPPGAVSNINAVQLGWDGEVVWRYNKNLQYTGEDGSAAWASMHHHDFQREGSPMGYYAPGSEPLTDRGNSLLLTHHRVRDARISDQMLIDERIIEVTWDGELIWEWKSHEHFDELGFDEAARKAIYAHPGNGGDWIHLNAISTLGKNRFYEAGDARFHPDNIICSSRECNIVFIIEKSTGKIVWRVGPDYMATPALRALGQIIGQHGVHMIPEGLPGAGNILLFDNGSFGGYGKPNACSQNGANVMRRHYSRALEFDPVTLEIKWEYMQAVRTPNGIMEMGAHHFFSPFISYAQRLPNGNTLITEGADGVFREVTPEKEIVWEFINPLPNPKAPEVIKYSAYRAYRVPYAWVPQLQRPEEVSVCPPDNGEFRVPGSMPLGDTEVVSRRFRKLVFSP